MNGLQVKNLSITMQQHKKQYSLFPPISFAVHPSEIITIMGASGCGKSTLLAAIAGHLDSAFTLSGTILFNGKSIVKLPPEKRGIGILFQDDLLFPHLNIWQNLAFALPRNIKGKKARKEHSMAVLESLKLTECSTKMPLQLSGGQRSRISVMRTLLSQPQVVLLDEPFSRLDNESRITFRQFVFDKIITAKIPALLVTHDKEDIWQQTKGNSNNILYIDKKH